jgi:Spy/CpxP family protein refolding chaperone
MKNLLNRVILPGITVAMLGLTTSAVAQWNNADDCGGPGMGRDSGRMQQMRERRQAELHDKLQLSTEQEKAWQTFIAQGKALRPQQRPDPQELAGLTAPQRMQKMLERMQQHEARMQKMLGALQTFYAVLTPQQQKIFDDTLPRPGERRMRRD